ncbi:MAG: peptide ABC transporter substrate-binding protein [Candidatus Sericytochromatia bacterium]|nr:peptide ABC transporter substrate-binding protein [Candidatus Tanganyikabacteria bacterium]
MEGDLMVRKHLASILLAISLLAACEPSKKDTAPGGQTGGATIVFQSQQEPDALNTLISDMVASRDATTPMMSGLIIVNDKMEYIPDLAAEVPTVENKGVVLAGKAMTVTYKLKPAKWHDGKPVTSADVKFTWETYLNPTVRVTSRDGWDKISAVETPDAQTAVVKFREVYAPYLNLFGVILPKHVLEADVKTEDKPGDSKFNHSAWNRAPIGSGPFKFKEWVAGDHISYEANPDYFGTKPKIAGLILKVVPDENTAFVQLKSGDIDIYQSAAITQYEQLKALGDVTVNETASLTYEHIDFNNENPLLAEKAVRKAIGLAINKEEISKKIYKGLYKVAHSDQFPLSYAYNPEVEKLNQFDPEKARQLLDAAGWKPGGDGIRMKDGKRLSLTISSTTGRKPRELTEQVLIQYLKAVGIELRIDNVPGPKLFGKPDGLLHSGKYDLGLYAWTTSPDPNNITLWNSKQIPPGGQNYTRFRNAEVDQLTEEGTRVVDRAKRAEIYRRIQAIMAEEMPMVPMLYWTTLDAVNNRVKGFRPNPTNSGNLWNCQEWYVE